MNFLLCQAFHIENKFLKQYFTSSCSNKCEVIEIPCIVFILYITFIIHIVWKLRVVVECIQVYQSKNAVPIEKSASVYMFTSFVLHFYGKV
jgi:hypothetical protein